MVSWRGAFKGALVTLLWSMLWIMIGLGVIISASLFGGMKIVSGPSGIEYSQPKPAIMIPATIIGVFLIGLGWMAAFYKVQHEVMTEGVEAPLSPRTWRRATVLCPSCGAENLPGSKYCIECGIRLI